jgi:phosphatidylserine/phosphatidylglycerophosphate/cardiolipin synthase-like enzyme
MRKRRTKSGLTVNAIAGTHVVLLGFDLADQHRAGCLGFAIQREDHTEGERYWLKGTKTFAETDPGLGPGGEVTSREHPFQTFQWADYSAKPEHDYTYSVIPLYGSPNRVREGGCVPVRVTTEAESGQGHSVFFNRGAISSQEYARRFQDRMPSELEGRQRDAAYRWLSRGLLEAFVTFVGRANGSSYGIYGACYEFQWPEALAAVKAAASAGADVEVIYDAIPGSSGPAQKNADAIAAAKMKGLCRPHTEGKLMHNKFFVLTKNGKPIAVWTGSTNLTENGIFGHSNCGHVVEDRDIAAAYLRYWEQLKCNEDCAGDRDWTASNNPAPPDPWSDDITAIFSPRSGQKVLKWYGDIAGSAKNALFMTFPFGMNKSFQTVYERNDGVLRFALMEKEGNGAGLPQGRKDIRRIRSLPNVVVAVGNNMITNRFDRWLAVLRKATAEAHVKCIHTKYMLVDPLGKTPVVVTGSANFSEASTCANDENMMVIRNDQRVVDIYLGEFMRMYSHYAFREAAAIWQAKHPGEEWKPGDLDPSDGWQTDYFTPGSQRFLRRQYFAG